MSDVRISWDASLGKLEDHLDEDAKPRAPALAPGTAHWTIGGDPQHRRYLSFVCPCGCGDIVASLPVKVGVKEDHRWEWDGNETLPTLKPSIRRTAGCKWHGFLTNGVFTGQCEA